MLTNSLKAFYRSLGKNKVFSFIRLSSISVGMICVLWVAFFIWQEAGYDEFHEKKERIYRAGFSDWQNGINEGEYVHFVAPFGPDAAAEFPEISAFCRVTKGSEVFILSDDGQPLKARDFQYADSSFFDVFSFPLLQGDPKTALSQPHSLVLGQSLAKKLFGNEPAIGKSVEVNSKETYMVTGVMADFPAQSHLQSGALASFSTLYADPRNYMDWNGGNRYATYFLLHQAEQVLALEDKLPDFMWKHINGEYATFGSRIDVSLQPLQDIHLHHQPDSANTLTNLYIIGSVAFLILVISCINFINLTITRAPIRYREIGVRKTMGATRGGLVWQFMGETLLTILLATIMTALLALATYPLYETLTGREVDLDISTFSTALSMLFALVVFTGLAAGVYPALYMSSFHATAALKAKVPRAGNSIFGQGLIIFQFAVAMALLVGTLIVNLQLNYLKSRPVGIDQEQIIVLSLFDEAAKDKVALLQQRLKYVKGVEHSSAVSEIPYAGVTSNGFVPEGQNQPIMIHQLDADENLLRTFGLEMVSGDYFDPAIAATKEGIIINETLARQLGWSNPVGKTISRDGSHPVIGVVRDFHFASLHVPVEPLIITRKPWDNRFQYLAIRYTGDPQAILAETEAVWKDVTGNSPFEFWFLDEAFDRLYRQEAHFRAMLFVFSALAITLAMLGLFGLVTLSVGQRTKEIGIRKVLGASVSGIVALLSKDFVKLVAVAIIIASPIAWWAMSKWLEDFAYRIDIEWWMFAVAGLAAVVIALLTVATQAIRAAVANPVESLRDE